MARAIRYKANSYIYFKGDASERVYILKAGKVSLNYKNIETGQDIHELIRTGEFFGVKSALGRYAREETAIALTDAMVIAFTVAEFEQFMTQNTRVIMKMLRVFSNQLRRIHKQVQNLLATEEQVDPEEGLFSIGEYYMKAKKYALALYPYKRYLVYYPSGTHSAEATKKIQMAESYLSRYGQAGRAAGGGTGGAGTGGAGAAASATAAAPRAVASGGGRPSGATESSDVSRQYYNAVSLVSQEKYEEAYGEFKKIYEAGEDPEYLAKSRFEMGKCLFYLKRYDECVRTFTGLVQEYPKHPDLADALYFVARSYEATGERAKAEGLLRKILSMVQGHEPVARRAKKALRAYEGG